MAGFFFSGTIGGDLYIEIEEVGVGGRGEREKERSGISLRLVFFSIRTFLKYCIDGQNHNYKVQMLWPI